MAILPILCYPDPRLHKVAQPVTAVDADGWVGSLRELVLA